jgi:transcriptional antiterminator NusG
VLVDMIVDDQSWYVVRNTPRVTGFVGSGVNPVPLKQKEVDELLGRMQATEGSSNTLSTSRLATQSPSSTGPFKELDGKVGEVDEARGKVKVLVAMFGRETPVELDFLQIKRI